MAGKTYVTKGYSTYTDIPAARRGGYDHSQENPVNQYTVETKTIQRIRASASGFTDFVGSPSKVELLKEYVHSPTMSGSPKYATTNNYEDYEPNYENSSSLRKSNNVLSPKKHAFSNPEHGYRSEESNRIPSEPGTGTGARHIRTGNISSPNKSWQSAGPPATHHPLTTSTNNVNEALGFLEESVYYSPRADPRRRGVLDDLSTPAQPLEPQRRYARPAFVSKPNDARYNFTGTGSVVDSHQTIRRYRGSHMP